MSLRIECSTFGLCTPPRAVETNKFVIPKILIENLIDDGFSVKEMSNILCVRKSSKTYGAVWLKNQRFFQYFWWPTRFQLVLVLTNDYSFCGETILRELFKGREIIIQHYRFRDSMHHVSEAGIQSRRKGRLKRRVYNVKGANHLWYIDTNHKLVKWYLIIFGQLTVIVGWPYHWNALAMIKLLVLAC